MENIEANNAKEEIQELVEKCNRCGLCKQLDPVFRAEREEQLSSRGKAILFSKTIFDESVFSDPLSGSCKQACPFDIDIDLAIRKARKILNLKGKGDPFYKKALKKIQNKENPYSD